MATSQLANAQGLTLEERLARKAAIRESRLSSNLFDLTNSPSARPQALADGPSSLTTSDYVVVDAIANNASVANRLAASLKRSGMRNVAVAGRVVSGEFPRAEMSNAAGIPELLFMRESIAIAQAGSVTSQGDAVMLGGTARSTYGVDGAGVIVGTLSDSYNCLGGAGADITSGDLPPAVNVIDESCTPSSTDEGRAMMQIITDVAPAATQAFHSATQGSANFIAGLDALQLAGASVIVDNVYYATEPFFQDGVIAQAVDAAAAAGVSYFSAAGNAGRVSYESPFADGGDGIYGPDSIAHGFDGAGPGADQQQEIMIPAGETVRIILQWDEPAASAGPVGSATDLDLYLSDAAGTSILASAESYNIGADPIEIITFTNGATGPTQFQVTVEHFIPFGGGPAGNFKYIILPVNEQNSAQIVEYNTSSGTLVGHANANGVFAIGATYHGDATPVAQSYSAAGGVDILFNTSGNALASPEARGNPDFMAPDGVNTTFFGTDTDSPLDGFPNFYGTSAAAAHAAGVAALYRDLVATNGETYTNATLLSDLQASATDMGAPGFDDDTGYGLINAKALLDLVPGSFPPPPPTVFISPIASAITGQSPDFVWQSVPSATWYQLWINDATGTAFVDWFTAASLGCSGATVTNCTASPALNLAWGNGVWWVQSWNPTRSSGPWSAAQNFQIDTGVIPPVISTLTAPTGNTTSTPTYEWASVPGASWYQLWVNDSTGNVIQTWYQAKNLGCAAGGTCSITPVTVLAPGNGQWWVRAWNTHGYGVWNNPSQTFTVTSPP